MTVCARCGRENPPDARFCNGCGAALEAARETRKTVTLLFADVTGSTAMGEQADPEVQRRTMSRAFDAMRAAIERHGGTVEKFAGDAVMAAFGVPHVHEDDALRALRAAVELRVAAEPLVLRIGVNTGPVMAGDGSTRDTFVTGDAVNVAARLEQAAAPGEILMGADTYALVRDSVEAALLPPLELKGKSSPVTVYRLDVLGASQEGRVQRHDAPMVGRGRQLELLRQTFGAVADERSSHLFTVLGSAGVGKSRLVREFLAELDGRARILRGRCLPYGEGITWWPLREALREHGLDDEAALAQELDGVDDAPTIARRAAALLALSDEASSPEDAWAARALLEGLAQTQPLVLVVDDIHWAQPALLELVESVADWSREAPILQLCTARPELLEARPDWGGGKVNASIVLLEPLGDADAASLVDSLLVGELASEARERIVAAAEGNPLFVEELVAMLIEDGVLIREGSRWRATRALGEVTVPPTIHALLAARLDHLQPHERTVIEAAAVEGKVFHRGAVAALAPEGLRLEVPERLRDLVRKDLVRPDRPQFEGEEAFRFRHLLIRDAAYDALPKQERAALHEQFADWLAARSEVVDVDEIVGYHLEQAAGYRRELGDDDAELAARAGEHLGTAGVAAFERGDYYGADGLLTRATSLLAANAPRRSEFLVTLASACWSSDLDIERAVTLLEEAIACAPDEQTATLASMERSYLRSFMDTEGAGFAAVAAEAARAIEVFRAAGEDASSARAYYIVGQAHNIRGELGRAAEIGQEGLAFARRSGSVRLELALTGLIGATGALGFAPWDDVEPHARAAAELATANGLVGEQVGATIAIALAHAERGRSSEALARVDEALALAERAHIGRWYDHFHATVVDLAGDQAEAERIFRHTDERFAATGEMGMRSTIVGELAGCALRTGRDDEALRLAELARSLTGADDVISQVLWRSARAVALSRRGELEEADRLGREAVELGRRGEYFRYRCVAFSALADVRANAGDTAEAVALLEELVATAEAKGSVVRAERARARIAELSAVAG